VRGVRAILWLHALRSRRYALTLLSNALTDALWALIPLLGAVLAGNPSLAWEVYWALVAWMLIANSAWLVGGWLEYANFLGVLEYHVHAGVSPVSLALGRTVTLLTSVAISSTLSAAPLLAAGWKPSVADPAALAAALAMLLLQSLAYGTVLAVTALRVSVPSALLDIASLAQLGALLLPITADQLPYLSLIPLLGPAYLAKHSALSSVGPAALAGSALTTALVTALAAAYTRTTEKKILKTGFRSVGFV